MNLLVAALNAPSDCMFAIAQSGSVRPVDVAVIRAQSRNFAGQMNFSLDGSKKVLKGRTLKNILSSCSVRQISPVAVRSGSCTCSDTSCVFGAKAISGEMYETL